MDLGHPHNKATCSTCDHGCKYYWIRRRLAVAVVKCRGAALQLCDGSWTCLSACKGYTTPDGSRCIIKLGQVHKDFYPETTPSPFEIMNSERTKFPLTIPNSLMSEHLIGAERYWARYQPWLKSIGYILRPRYQPDWKPSWLTSNRPESESEDSLVVQLRALVLDARRQCDNFPVALKLVPTTTQELPIWRYLSSPERLVDSRNHCVPLLTIHPLPDTDDLVLSVMPLLLSYRIPTFDTVGEVLSCVHHLLQGLTFLHEHNVTHLDICTQNTMHDPGSKLYPKGFHPLQPSSYTPDPNSPQLVPSYSVSSRTLAPVKFYFIDFGESFMFESYKKRHYISGSVGHYPDLPEFPDDRYYDPFPVDIRALGETLRRGFSSNYSDLKLLDLVFSKMRVDEPARRISAADALSELSLLRATQDVTMMRKPLKERGFTEDYWQTEIHRHIFEAPIKGVHPLQSPVPELNLDEVKLLPLLSK